jgi:hypothetical protein
LIIEKMIIYALKLRAKTRAIALVALVLGLPLAAETQRGAHNRTPSATGGGFLEKCEGYFGLL